MTPSLHGWEAFLMHGALTRTRITWTSHQQCHKSQVSLWGPPCTYGVLGIPHGEVRNNHYIKRHQHIECISNKG